MLMYGISPFEEKPQSYSKYKGNKFEKTKTKVKTLMDSVNDSSLKPKDKEKLISDIKTIVSQY